MPLVEIIFTKVYIQVLECNARDPKTEGGILEQNRNTVRKMIQNEGN